MSVPVIQDVLGAALRTLRSIAVTPSTEEHPEATGLPLALSAPVDTEFEVEQLRLSKKELRVLHRALAGRKPTDDKRSSPQRWSP